MQESRSYAQAPAAGFRGEEALRAVDRRYRPGSRRAGAVWRVLDPIGGILAYAFWPLARLATMPASRVPVTTAAFDRIGLSVVRHHYYQPVVRPRDLRAPLDAPRALPGIDFNLQGQLDLVSQFRYADELRAIPMDKGGPLAFGYRNGNYGPGDAEILYNVIRHFRPCRIVEIGSGQSTLLALLAVKANAERDPAYTCEITCIEPYEQPWLEQTGVRVIRRRVEDCEPSVFEALGENDILFIDSSHVIRPQGDVLHEYLDILPRLAPGVMVHIHDVFTPRDYPADFLFDLKLMWDEQYLLEAFLSFNAKFEVMLAVNMLANDYLEALARACPILYADPPPASEPGAFWIRRI